MLDVAVCTLYKSTPKCVDRHLNDQMCRLQLTAGMQPLHVPHNIHNGLLLAAAVVENPGQGTTGQGSVDQLMRDAGPEEGV